MLKVASARGKNKAARTQTGAGEGCCCKVAGVRLEGDGAKA